MEGTLEEQLNLVQNNFHLPLITGFPGTSLTIHGNLTDSKVCTI